MDTETGARFTCTNCSGQSMHTRRVRSVFWHDERLVVVEDIPALVCDSCGEQFYDDSTTIGLDRLRGWGFPPERARSEMQVAVFSFDDSSRLLEGS